MIQYKTILPCNLTFWSLYYPSLKKIDAYNYNKNVKNILILGGSVVYSDSVGYFRGKEYIHSSFCGFNTLDTSKYNVLNLAYPAHNSLDSRYKLDLLKGLKFDFVFIYHGINDTRTNNIDSLLFDPNYRHIEFYDELFVLTRHPEINYFLTFYYIDYLWIKILKHIGLKKYIPKEFLPFLFKKDDTISKLYFGKGCIFPSSISFKKNIEHIVDHAVKRKIKPILFTYAYYQPYNYSFDRFINYQLDYSTNYFPTELYGDPNCVPRAIKFHNNAIKNIVQNNKKVIYFDFNDWLPKNSKNFMDICHLTENGCYEMYSKVIEIIESENSKTRLNSKK